MKRIKTVNGYTIYEATSARDEANYNCRVGSYNIYISSDIRDFGLSNSYPEYEDIDLLSVAEAMCGASKYAVAVDLAEEISGSTAQDMDLVLEIERLLESGMSIEEVRDHFDEDLHELDELGERLAAVSAELEKARAISDAYYEAEQACDISELAQTVSTEAEAEISFPTGEGRTYPTILKLLWAEAEDWCIDYFYAFPLAEHWADTLDPAHELSFTCYNDNCVEVNDAFANVIDDTTTLSDIIHDFETAFEDYNINRSHASYIVCRDPDSGEYETKSQPLTEGLPTQAHADHALLHEAAKMYAFADCGGWEVVEIVIDGFRIEYSGWLPGMRFVFRCPETGNIVFDESFPEWDH
ncbi:MAG: hypothetical protein IIY48_05360 [Clostridia bacterium]|nr:hypothetical protein [Clostridia bacterium]